MWEAIKQIHTNLKARALRYWRAREVVKVLAITHASELAQTPVNMWAVKKAEQSREIAAVKSGQFPIVDRRSWQFPYIPEALHRLNQPVLKNCFSDDTEILTKRGWILISDVKKGDYVISRLEDGSCKWVPIFELKKFKYKGEMFHFNGEYVDLLVSPDHRMYGRFRSSTNYWGENRVCSVCKAQFKTSQALGSHRRKIHGIAGVAEQHRKENNYDYGKVGFTFAKDVAKWLHDHASSSTNAFEIPVQTKWRGQFPSNYDKVTGKVSLECLNTEGNRVGRSYAVSLEDWVAFLGIYTAEGSARGTLHGLDLSPDSKDPHYVQAIAAEASGVEMVPTGHGYGVRISQTKRSKHREEIADLMVRLPFGFEEDGENDFGTIDKTLHSHLFPLGNSYTKKVPDWVKELPPKYISIFIEWAMKGDGHEAPVKDKGGRTYFTVSKKLADDMQELFLKAGTEASVHKKDNFRKGGFGKKGRTAPIYSVSEHGFEFKGIREENVKIVQGYDGYIYCPAIPPYETVYVRRKLGIACWCGRTPYNL